MRCVPSSVPESLARKHGESRARPAGGPLEFRDALSGVLLFEYCTAAVERWCESCQRWIPVRGALGALAFEVEHPLALHPSEEARRLLAESFPGAVVLPAPAVVRLAKIEQGPCYAVLAPAPPHPGAAWRVVLGERTLAVGATAQEAVDRALELARLAQNGRTP